MPSPWRAQLVDAIAGPAHIATLTETLPGWARKLVVRHANQITASIARAPAGVVFGYRQIDAMLEGALFEPLGYNFERRVRICAKLTRLNVGIAMVVDRLPWSHPIRERRNKTGAAARERRPFDIGRGLHRLVVDGIACGVGYHALMPGVPRPRRQYRVPGVRKDGAYAVTDSRLPGRSTRRIRVGHFRGAGGIHPRAGDSGPGAPRCGLRHG
jgi:hypothetical protein